jgi:peptidoglycan/LPS O-acetylase OafA/YrhL
LSFTLGGLLQLSEAGALSILKLHPFAMNDFLCGTLPFGLGAFLVALAWPRDWRPAKALAFAGRYSLGLYAIHPFILLLLAPALVLDDLWSRLALGAVALAGSLGFCAALARLPVAKGLVS